MVMWAVFDAAKVEPPRGRSNRFRPALCTGVRVGVSILFLALLGGCTAMPAPTQSEAAAGVPAGRPHWWIVRVGMGHEAPAKVKWHL
jgi:hypothetical protein